MPDKEKVIKGLSICRHKTICQENCMECPYIYDKRSKQSNCEGVLHDDALALLKEQEAKEVKVSTNMYTGLPITHCPKCGVSIDRYLYGRQHEGQVNYCPYCGQEVTWNDIN